MLTRLVRELREQYGKTQDDLARAGQAAGLAWTRATVADLEHGRRRFDLEDFRRLPTVLFHLTGRLYSVTLTAETNGSRVEWDSPAMSGLPRDGGHYGTKTVRVTRRPAIGDAEQKVARRWGVSPDAVLEAAQARLGRSLSEERDRRVAEQAPVDAPPRTRQAIRGHVTRQLVAELARVVRPERARKRARAGRIPPDSSPRQRSGQTKTPR